MTKKFLLFLLILFYFPNFVWGQTPLSPYEINEFQAKIEINQDASITVEEKIKVSFNQPRHGIFRVIPVVYTTNGRTLRTNFNLISVQDDQGEQVAVKVSDLNQSKNLKIGQPDKTVSGERTYFIKYVLKRVIQRDDDYDELYWNVTGSEWDTPIERASVVVTSDYAEISQTKCFAGLAGSKQQNCQQVESTKSQVVFETKKAVGQGQDFTIVIGLDKNNDLQFPGFWQRLLWTVGDNWGYGLAVLPLFVMAGFWWKKGRDKRYLSDNVYFPAEDKETKSVNPLVRKHLPMVYHPIDRLTPAQVGTIIDEQVHLRDVVAEIIELGRLGYLHLDRIKQKGLFVTDDYRLRKREEADKELTDYQIFLMEKLFKEKNEIKISELKNEFYQYLDEFKKKLYQSLVKEKAFPNSPDRVRKKWLAVAIGLAVLVFGLLTFFVGSTSNTWPIFVAVASSVISVILAGFMPRKTAWGYSLHRQAKGLKYYLGKGKWRQEIAEKHLFLQEILPLAISLGVVGQLAKDMAELGVKPPEYVHGFTAANLNQQMKNFNSLAVSSLSARPSGRSSWSGRSGFSSGGSSGGGFGGGGGGSW